MPEFLPAEIRDAKPAETEVEAELQSGSVPDADWQALPKAVEAALGGSRSDLYRVAREEFDRLLILRVMRFTRGNQFQAAEILGISRVTLRAKLRALGIAAARAFPAEDGQS